MSSKVLEKIEFEMFLTLGERGGWVCGQTVKKKEVSGNFFISEIIFDINSSRPSFASTFSEKSRGVLTKDPCLACPVPRFSCRKRRRSLCGSPPVNAVVAQW